MSSGPKKNADASGTRFITMDAEEFNKVCHRLNGMLNSRVEKAWKKYQTSKTEKNSDNHVEASKDAFAFLHLLEIVDHMTEEIVELRSIVEGMGLIEEEEEYSPVMGPQKKKYLN